MFQRKQYGYQPVGRELRGNEVQGVQEVASCLCQVSDAVASYSGYSGMQYRVGMLSPKLFLGFFSACMVIEAGV